MGERAFHDWAEVAYKRTGLQSSWRAFFVFIINNREGGAWYLFLDDLKMLLLLL